MNAREILEQAVREDVSDIFIVAGLPVSCRKNGNIIQTQEEKLFPKETEALLNEIYGMAGDRDMMNLLVHGDDDFSFAIPGVSRFRVSAYKQLCQPLSVSSHSSCRIHRNLAFLKLLCSLLITPGA